MFRRRQQARELKDLCESGRERASVKGLGLVIGGARVTCAARSLAARRERSARKPKGLCKRAGGREKERNSPLEDRARDQRQEQKRQLAN